MIEEIRNIKSGKKELRNFGSTIGIVLLLIAGVLFYKNNNLFISFAYIAGVFIVLGFLFPQLLKPIYFIWMIFAVVVGWIMTRLILSVLFFVIISIIRLIAGIFGKSFLELNISKDSKSYWNHRFSDVEMNQDYEKQF
tara:strand:- start:3184 stop:3597 length:414 start_codon:yes stop_codon:yes gene_type:complete